MTAPLRGRRESFQPLDASLSPIGGSAAKALGMSLRSSGKPFDHALAQHIRTWLPFDDTFALANTQCWNVAFIWNLHLIHDGSWTPGILCCLTSSLPFDRWSFRSCAKRMSGYSCVRRASRSRMSLQKVSTPRYSSYNEPGMLTHCLDEFEVAIFLRESRTRHSLLTRNKTFHGKEHQDQDLRMELKPDHVSGDTAANPVNSTDGGIMIESDSEADLELHNIPVSEDEVALGDGRRSSKRSRTTRRDQVPPEDTTSSDEKKLRFSTHYESFNIHRWVLCLLITRKGDKTRPSAGVSESNRQPLMEEWISTQAQASVDDD